MGVLFSKPIGQANKLQDIHDLTPRI